MEMLLYALLAIVGVGAAGFALVPTLMGSSRADKRIKALQGDIQLNRRNADAARTRDNRRKQIQDQLKAAQNEATGRTKRHVPLQEQIYQAGMKTKVSVWVRNQVIVGVIVAVICFFLQVPLLFCPVFGVAAAYLLPKLYLGRRTKRYQNAYLEELPNAVEAIVRGVKSGLPLNDSMRLVAKEAKEPVKSEYGWHVIRLEEKRKEDPPVFNVEQIRIRNDMIRELVTDEVEALRAAAVIEIVPPPQPPAAEGAPAEGGTSAPAEGAPETPAK